MKPLIIIVSLFLGAVIGVGGSYAVYTPKINDYVSQVNTLSGEISGLNIKVSDQERKITGLESEQVALETNLAAVQTENEQIKAENVQYQAEIKTLESQASSLTSQLASSVEATSAVQGRLDNILGVTVRQFYQWDYGSTWQWELPIPLSVYDGFLEKPRPDSVAYWVDMAMEQEGDTYVLQMVQKFDDAAVQKRFTDRQKLNFVIAFVQSLPYTSDSETTPFDEYPRYPVETLFDRGGDCEDTSILVAALLYRMGYDVALLALLDAGHMAVGIALPGDYGVYYSYEGKHYFYLETTGEGWQIGQFPSSITETQAYIFPVGG